MSGYFFFLFVFFLGSLSPRAATPLAARTPYKATPRVRQAQRRSAFPGWLPAAAAEARPRAPRDTFLERTSHACLRPPNTPECLRRRPSVSLEHQHSTPAVLHCAAHSFDPGEPSHRSTFLFFSRGTSYPRSRPANTFRVFAKASERFFGASTLHACRITLRGAFL